MVISQNNISQNNMVLRKNGLISHQRSLASSVATTDSARGFAESLVGHSMVRERGRRVVCVVGAVLAVLSIVLLSRVSEGSATQIEDESQVLEVESGQETTRVVEAGDTLWSIAVELAPNEDPRHSVDLLIEANGGSTILAGQTISVPAELVSSELAE